MPKVVDHEERRRELAHAVWRVIRRQGVDRASVRTVALEAGWSPGALHQACTSSIQTLAAAGNDDAGQARALEAERLHALIDGLAVHTALRPDLMKPEQIVAVLRLHLDALDSTTS